MLQKSRTDIYNDVDIFFNNVKLLKLLIKFMDSKIIIVLQTVGKVNIKNCELSKL